jgi:hypothetical protein
MVLLSQHGAGNGRRSARESSVSLAGLLLLGANDGFCYSSLLNKPDVSIFQKRPEWLKTRALNLLCRIAGQS